MRRWFFMAVAFPVAAWLLAQIADRIAAARGEGRLTRVLRYPLQKRRSA
jgi:hypothetical protein